MGSDAAIFVFDYQRYNVEVVPAFHALLLNGEVAPWLRAVMEKRHQVFQRLCGGTYAEEFDLTLLRNTDLLRYCTYLTADLAFVAGQAEVDPMDACHLDWEQRACRSTNCPVRAWCPFHIRMPQQVIEELHGVLQAAICARCLGKSQFVGRTMNAARYTVLLDRMEVEPNHPVRGLLQALGMRGFVIGYQWTSDCDGIHGWLDSGETREVVSYLEALELPRYASDFGTMQERQHFFQGDALDWYALSLSFVRTVATIAAEAGQSILWGNDMGRILQEDAQ